uniref:Acetylornithine/succinyldiaminopimelate aminotransferase n=1 Tax=Candidatus Methanophaga sp. ANME-1 ERB7 TaxID=2759913 RepID=A0A7G9ZBC0_9EURY|nr:acetylornithine/succinyldiaminopimelate aminotransferase [Methanosarcinales archaeon ANME-1 ERB7]
MCARWGLDATSRDCSSLMGPWTPITRDRIVVEGFKEGIVLLPCGDSAIRFSPPLVITKEEVNTGLDRFEAAVKKVFA